MVKQINTFSKDCQDELKEQLPVIYKDQFKDYNLISVNYNALLTDLETYWNQEARFREGFTYTENSVSVPNFFCKLNGISLEAAKKKTKNKQEKTFEKNLKFLLESKLTKVIKNKPLFDLQDKKDSVYEDIFVKNKMTFDELQLESLLSEYSIKALTNLSIRKRGLYKKKLIELFKELEDKNDEFKARLLTYLLLPTEELCILINNFDYAFDVPKLVVINTELDEVEAYSYYFLNYLGFDIVFLNPSGKVTVDKYFDINEVNYGYFKNINILKEKFSLKKSLGKLWEDITAPHIRYFFLLFILSIILTIFSIIFYKNGFMIFIQFVGSLIYLMSFIFFINIKPDYLEEIDSIIVEGFKDDIEEKFYIKTNYFLPSKYIKFFLISISVILISGCILGLSGCVAEVSKTDSHIEYTTTSKGHLNIDNEVLTDEKSGLKVLTDKEFSFNKFENKLIGYIGIPQQQVKAAINGKLFVNNKKIGQLPTFYSEEYISELSISYTDLDLSREQEEKGEFEITIQFYKETDEKVVLFTNSYPVKII